MSFMDMSLKRWIRFEIASILVVILVYLLTMSSFGVVRADYQNVTVVNSAYVRVDQATTNFGSNSDLSTYGSSSYRYAYIEIPESSFLNVLSKDLYFYSSGGQSPHGLYFLETESFSEGSLTYNNKPMIDVSCTSILNSYVVGWVGINISDCTTNYIVGAISTSGGMWNFNSDDGANPLYVRYTGNNLTNYIVFDPDVNQTNTTSISYNYFASSSVAHFGSYVILVKVRVYNSVSGSWESGYEYWVNQYAVEDTETSGSLSGWLSSSFYVNKKLEITALLNDSIGNLVSDTIIYDPSYNLPVVPEITNIPSPSWTPVVIPDVGVEPNESINGSWSSDWYNYSNNTMSQYNESISGVFSFIQQPLRNMRGYVDTINQSFSTGAFNTSKSFLTVVCPCIIQSIHWKIKAVMSLYFSMVFVLILIGRS